ncbi:MAG: type IV pilus biogenesis/stability protein PilW [Betaproteobacteria bacterium]
MRAWAGSMALAMVLLAAGCASITTTTTSSGATITSTPSDRTGEADPRKRAAVRLQLASSYYQQGLLRVALDEARAVVQMDSDLAGAYALLGLIYMDLDDRAQADANFQRALRLEPDNPEWQNNYGWFLCRSGQVQHALPYFERAAGNRLYPTPGLALGNAGVCLLNERDYRAAEAYLRRAFELDAASPVTKFNLARVYLALGQPDRAAFYYGLLDSSLEPTAETLWLGLRIARARGDTRTERQLGDELRRRFPGSPEAVALRRGAYDG